MKTKPVISIGDDRKLATKGNDAETIPPNKIKHWKPKAVHQIVLDWLGTNNLKEMFPSHEVLLQTVLSVLFGAMGGIIIVLFVRMWEKNGAAEVRENKVPQENDERFG